MGARAVVSSLWKVSDDATALLMRGFYRRLRAGDAAVVSDAVQIHQLLMNLGTNAAHAMTQAGTLTVSLEAINVLQARQAKLGAIAAGARLRGLNAADTSTAVRIGAHCIQSPPRYPADHSRDWVDRPITSATTPMS